MARNRQPVRALEVRKAFRFGGRAFRPGDEFRPDRLAISERKLARLIGSRFVVEQGEMEEASERTRQRAEQREQLREATRAQREARAAGVDAEEEETTDEAEGEEPDADAEDA